MKKWSQVSKISQSLRARLKTVAYAHQDMLTDTL